MEEEHTRTIGKSKTPILIGVLLIVLGTTASVYVSVYHSDYLFNNRDTINNNMDLSIDTSTIDSLEQVESESQFSGQILLDKTIISDENIFTLEHSLEERRRLILEGNFDSPVSVVGFKKPYYDVWLLDGQIKTNLVYIKDPVTEFARKVDINIGDDGVYYFIFLSESPINGNFKIYELSRI